MPPRFVSLADLAEILNISARQASTLLHSGDIPGIQVGGRGQWRIETTEVEAYIQRKYAETRAMVEEGRPGHDAEARADGHEAQRE